MSFIQSIHDGSTPGTLVSVECVITNGLPAIIIVGLGNKAIDEAKERLRSAFHQSKIAFPKKRITLNLAPADIPKDSTSFDCALAVAILYAQGTHFQHKPTDKDVFIGELSLNGDVRPVRGIIGKILASKQRGITTFFIPYDNLDQAKLIPGITLFPCKTLAALTQYLQGQANLPKIYTKSEHIIESTLPDFDPFKSVVGQALAKRALVIAAAGRHNILLCGPPGTGKSMLAKTMPDLMPSMTKTEMLEATQLHSLAGTTYETIVTKRPFRAPHHSASHTAITGGGNPIKPGEISLSHTGILFLDEMPEFKRSTLEALRQPLEEHTITIARADQNLTFPAHFVLVATANPCPCGLYGSNKTCTCSLRQRLTYQQRISGPILDRIDLHVTVDSVSHAQLLQQSAAQPSPVPYITAAVMRQKQRFASHNIESNAAMTNDIIRGLSKLEPEAKTLLDTAAEKLRISARGYMKTVKVARTIADLDDKDKISLPHITEALQYRQQISHNV